MKQEILQSLRETLKYHQDIGISGYRSDGIISQFLKRESGPPPVRENPAKKTLVLRDSSSVPETRKEMEMPAAEGVSIDDIHQDVVGCTGCSLRGQRVFAAPGSAVKARVRLLVVGDWCRVDNEGAPNTLLMGAEEDVMLARMMKAINLDEEKYFVTSVIKCALQKGRQPKAEHVSACLGYLHRQIHALRPEAILAMGMIGTRALLNKKEPLSRLRGKLHPFSIKESRPIPLMPTYHPNYLLQNPEMKQATWSDLQVLARHLKLLS